MVSFGCIRRFFGAGAIIPGCGPGCLSYANPTPKVEPPQRAPVRRTGPGDTGHPYLVTPSHEVCAPFGLRRNGATRRSTGER
jgi:hypothetical protein